MREIKRRYIVAVITLLVTAGGTQVLGVVPILQSYR
jgi:hypothetical protein